MPSKSAVALVSIALCCAVWTSRSYAADPVRSNQAAPTGSAGGTELGISPNPAQNTTGEANNFPVATPESAPVRSGLFPALGTTLLDHGIDIHGVVNDRVFANPSVGSNPGFGYNIGVFRPAVDFDLEKLFGIPGGTIHFANSFTLFKSNTQNYLFEVGGELACGSCGRVNEANALTLLTYEQRLLDNKLLVELGRTNLRQYFWIANSIDPYSYESGLTYADADINSITYSQWGGRVNYHFTPAWYVQAGATQDDFRRGTTRNYAGGNALASGVNIVAELAYRTNFSTAAYPGNLEAGFEWNTRNGYSNIKGTGAGALPGRTAADYPGGGLAFLQGAQTVWRGPSRPGSPPQNVTLYGSTNIAVDKPQPIDFDVTGGANFTGFIPLRPNDVFGVELRYQRLSAVEAAFETRGELLRGGTKSGTQSRNGYRLEVVDRVQLSPWLAMTPLVQYFITPDAYLSPNRARPKDGWFVGVFGTVSIGPLLGTSSKPF